MYMYIYKCLNVAVLRETGHSPFVPSVSKGTCYSYHLLLRSFPTDYRQGNSLNHHCLPLPFIGPFCSQGTTLS